MSFATMTSAVIDQGGGGIFGSPPVSGNAGISMDESRSISHKCEDPGGDPETSGHPDALRQTLKDVMSLQSYQQVQTMKREIDKLTKVERLLLYLDLPSSLTGMSDPLRQPLNPLGSRHEIQLTITWIKTHLEEDPQVSLPKHEVYDEYLEYCNYNGLKQLSTADFGKVMKQVFPQVRPRRLGTRGNSRYCYAGLKKRLKLEEPSTAEFSGDKSIKQVKIDSAEELSAAASFLIREWVEKLLGVKFGSLSELAVHLIEKMYVDNRSEAAFTVITAVRKSCEAGSMEGGNRPSMEMQDYKRKHEIATTACESVASKRGNLKRKVAAINERNSFLDVGRVGVDGKDNLDIMAAKVGGKLTVEFTGHSFGNLSSRFNQQQCSVTTTTSQVMKADPLPPPPPPVAAQKANQTWGESVKESGIDDELVNYFKDNSVVAENDQKREQLSQLRQLLEKNLQSPTMNMASANSAFKPAIKPENCGNWVSFATNPTVAPQDVVVAAASNANVVDAGNDGRNPLSSRRRVSFNPLIVQDPVIAAAMSENSVAGEISTTNNSNVAAAINVNSVMNANNSSNSNSSSNGLIPGPSPGNRKRHFSFQPISPRQVSLPQSPSASPFISPRSTPVPPMMRSRHSSGNALPLHLLPQSGNNVMVGGQKVINNFTSSSSDVSRAATFGSASECSTPFISPHATPIHFNRSRHNSAQGRLCRSRHSSGLAPYRYAMTFSPMALNNLNNPYSPQPATPVGTSSSTEDMFMATTYAAGGGGDSMIGNSQQQQQQQGTIAPSMLNQTEEEMRSRHSSSGSCGGGGDVNNRSAPISPQCGGKVKDVVINSAANNAELVNEFGQPDFKRHRHASAGNASSYNRPPSDWMGGGGIGQQLVQQRQQQQQQHDLLRSQSVPLNQIVASHRSAGLCGSNNNDEPLSDFPMSEGVVNSNFAVTSEMELLNSAPNPSPTSSGKDGGVTGGGGGGGAQDDLDMTLSALKDCDNDFSKFVQEVENGK